MHITMICYCRHTRSILFLEDVPHRLPSIEMRPGEAQSAAFFQFIRDHFCLNPEVFNPVFRIFGSGECPVSGHFVFCAVREPTYTLCGKERLRLKWVARGMLQDESLFAQETIRVFSSPIIQEILFGFRSTRQGLS